MTRLEPKLRLIRIVAHLLFLVLCHCVVLLQGKSEIVEIKVEKACECDRNDNDCNSELKVCIICHHCGSLRRH